MFPRLAATCCALLAVAPWPVAAKWVHGRVSLVAKQATVVTKFCFDFNEACKSTDCPEIEKPGMMNFLLSAGRRIYTGDSTGGASGAKPAGKPEADDAVAPGVYIALLDDEYFSYPEVSQVWGEANCTDVLKASKKSILINWQAVKGKDGESIHVPLVEKIRPRWWYVAFVSCSDHSYELDYSLHLENRRRGFQSEFSMDAMGVLSISFCLSAVFSLLLFAQLSSLREWQGRTGTGLGVVCLSACGIGGKAKRANHPSLLLLTMSTLLSLGGNVCWLVYYLDFARSGEAPERWAVMARSCIVSAKTLMQIILMVLAAGACVCSPDIIWGDHWELILGQTVFGALSLALELVGDSQFWTSSTEFVYDTRPGCALVAFDMLWLWSFVTRSYATFRKETRPRPRRFYVYYGPVFALWFAALPLVAALARAVAPWVRARVTFAASGATHALALAALVHTFRPSVASEVYALRTQEYESVNDDEELDGFLSKKDDDDMI